MINRRAFLRVLAGTVLTLPQLLSAQRQKIWHIGILSPRSKPSAWDEDRFGAFLKGMQDLGYVEGKNIKIDARFADGKLQALEQLASDLLSLKVDVIVTAGTPSVRAAQRATNETPIVSGSFADPVASGFAASLSHPGGNITGLSNLGEDMYAKRLEMLTETLPKLNRIAWIVNPDNAATMRLVPRMEAAAHEAGRESLVIKVRGPHELEEAFSTMAEKHVGAFIVADDGVLDTMTPRIVALAFRHKLPSVFAHRQMVQSGGLMSYGLDPSYTYYRLATFVDRILKGAKPGDLPIEQSAKLELVINARTAGAIGVAVPDEIRLRADTIIE